MDPVIDHTLRLGLRLLFAAALVHKLRDLGAFRRTLDAYRLVPAALVPVALTLVVALEAAVQVLLGGREPNPAGLVVAGSMLLLYAGAIAVNLGRGRDRIDCGCVGAAGRDGLSWWLVGRNVVLAAAAFADLAPVAARELTAVDRLTVAAATCALAGLYVAADGLVANASAYRRLREAV